MITLKETGVAFFAPVYRIAARIFSDYQFEVIIDTPLLRSGCTEARVGDKNLDGAPTEERNNSIPPLVLTPVGVGEFATIHFGMSI